MNLPVRLFAAGALLLAPVLLPAKIVRTVERTFAAEPGGRLTASTQGGDITILTADITEVRVAVRQTIKAADDAEADRLLQDLQLVLEQRGAEVVAESKFPRQGGWFRRGANAVRVDLTVTLPRRHDLALTTSGGNISVTSVQGDVRARTSGGNLRFQSVDGNLDGRTSGGNITVESGTASLKLHTSGGNVTVREARGPTEISTSGGDIRLDAVADLVSATTSGGNIRATLTGPLARDASLGTSGGSVTVRVPATAAFMLDARTSGGNVRASGLTLKLADGGLGKSRLAGEVNGGGHRLKLRSSGGNITLQTE